MKTTILFSALLLCTALAPARAADVSTVPHVDLSRYMGRWYVISHLPNFVEKNKVGTSDNYAPQPDGRMLDTFVFKKRSFAAPEKSWSGPAWVVDPASNAVWKVRLFWPFVAGYRVLELDPDYRWVAVANDSGSLLWIMARATSLDEGTYQRIVRRLAARGLETAKLEKVPQQP